MTDQSRGVERQEARDRLQRIRESNSAVVFPDKTIAFLLSEIDRIAALKAENARFKDENSNMCGIMSELFKDRYVLLTRIKNLTDERDTALAKVEAAERGALERAAECADDWKPEGVRLPVGQLTQEFVEGWEAACETVAVAIRTLTPASTEKQG